MISSLLAIIFMILISAYPIFISIVIFKNMNKLNNEEFLSRYGSLYDGLKTDCKLALLYNLLYTIRRLILAIMIVILSDYPNLQIFSYIMSNII